MQRDKRKQKDTGNLDKEKSKTVIHKEMKAFIKQFGSISVTLERWVCINKTKTKSYQEGKKGGRKGGKGEKKS